MSNHRSPVTIHSLFKGTDVSLNACSQALKALAPGLSRSQFFDLLGVPISRISKARYWEGRYNISPWSGRHQDEQKAALAIARTVLDANDAYRRFNLPQDKNADSAATAQSAADSVNLTGQVNPLNPVAKRRTGRVTLHECERALGAARADHRAPLTEIVERERRWFARQLLLGRNPESSVSRWLHRKFSWAAHNASADDIRLLIDVGAHTVSRHRGILPLHLAAYFGFVEGVELLIAAGADVTAKTEEQSTPLHAATRRAKLALIKILISHGAAINAADARGMTALQCLLDRDPDLFGVTGVPQAMEVLLNSGANTTATASSLPPLHLAIINISSAAAIMLVDHGADVTGTDSKGNTPLHCFWQSRLSLPELESVLATLIRHGANPKALNITNQSPSELAAMVFQPDIVNLLVRFGG